MLCGWQGWNVTSAGWQVTLCDPKWHVSSSSGVATSVSELLYPCYFSLLTLLHFLTPPQAWQKVMAAYSRVDDLRSRAG